MKRITTGGIPELEDSSNDLRRSSENPRLKERFLLISSTSV